MRRLVDAFDTNKVYVSCLCLRIGTYHAQHFLDRHVDTRHLLFRQRRPNQNIEYRGYPGVSCVGLLAPQ